MLFFFLIENIEYNEDAIRVQAFSPDMNHKNLFGTN